VAQMVEYLSSKPEDLSLTPTTTKKKKERKHINGQQAYEKHAQYP
jgi:hypothetical protein